MRAFLFITGAAISPMLVASSRTQISNELKNLLMKQTGCREKNLDIVFTTESDPELSFAIQPVETGFWFPTKLASALKKADFHVTNVTDGKANCGWIFLNDLDCGDSKCGTLFWKPTSSAQGITPSTTNTDKIHDTIQGVSMKYMDTIMLSFIILLLAWPVLILAVSMGMHISDTWLKNRDSQQDHYKIWPFTGNPWGRIRTSVQQPEPGDDAEESEAVEPLTKEYDVDHASPTADSRPPSYHTDVSDSPQE